MVRVLPSYPLKIGNLISVDFRVTLIVELKNLRNHSRADKQQECGNKQQEIFENRQFNPSLHRLIAAIFSAPADS